jgi:hypothetical protein
MSIIAHAAPPQQSAPEAGHSRSEFRALVENQPAASSDWLTELDMLREIPVCRRTLKQWRDDGTLPFVRLPGSRRIIYHRKTVESALLRHQKGGE